MNRLFFGMAVGTASVAAVALSIRPVVAQPAPEHPGVTAVVVESLAPAHGSQHVIQSRRQLQTTYYWVDVTVQTRHSFFVKAAAYQSVPITRQAACGADGYNNVILSESGTATCNDKGEFGISTPGTVTIRYGTPGEHVTSGYTSMTVPSQYPSGYSQPILDPRQRYNGGGPMVPFINDGDVFYVVPPPPSNPPYATRSIEAGPRQTYALVPLRRHNSRSL